MSFGAFGGAKAIMDIYDPTQPGAMPHAGTFNNNVFSMTAGIAALAEVFTPDVAEALHARGETLRQDVNQIFADAGVTMCVSGKGSLMNVHGVSGPITKVADLSASNDAAKELLFLDLLAKGFYIARRGFIALSMVIIDAELEVFKQALTDVVRVRRSVLPQ